MPEEEVVKDDVINAQDQEVTGQTVPPTGDDTETADENLPEKLKGKSREEIASIYVEDEKFKGEQAEQIGNLTKELESIKDKNQLAEAMTKVAELATPKVPEKPKTDWDAVKNKLVEKHGEETGTAMYETLATANSWIQEDVKSAKSEIAKARQEFADEIKAVREQQVTLSPEYRENKELADSLASQGMPMDNAIKMAAILSDQMPSKSPDRLQPPVGVNGTRTITTEAKPESYLSQEDKAGFEADGMSVEEIATMEAEEKSRAARPQEAGVA